MLSPRASPAPPPPLTPRCEGAAPSLSRGPCCSQGAQEPRGGQDTGWTGWVWAAGCRKQADGHGVSCCPRVTDAFSSNTGQKPVMIWCHSGVTFFQTE